MRMKRAQDKAYKLAKGLVKSVYASTVRSLYGHSRSPASEFNGNMNILVVRTDGLGDLLLATPMLRHLRRSFAQHRITLLTREEWLEAVETCPYVDELISWNIRKYNKNLFYRLRFIHALRNRRFDLALYPAYSRERLIDEVLCCCRAARKIGFDGDLVNISSEEKARNDSYYTKLVEPRDEDVLELDRNRKFTEEATGKMIEREDFQPEMWLKGSDRVAARRLLAEAGLNPSRELIVALFPAASVGKKLWPANHYAELGDRIVQRYGAKILICGAVSDSTVAADVQSQMRRPALNFAGKTSLRELAALFEACALYIGNDTGPLHMAVILGISTLGIIGGGQFGRFYPWGDPNRHRIVFKKMDCYHCNWHCMYDTIRCVQDISVDDVWLATQRIMEEVVLPERQRRVASSESGGASLELRS